MVSKKSLFPFDAHVPPSLLKIQKWTAQLITRPFRQLDSLNLPFYDAETTNEIEENISPGAHLNPSQSLGIYNQQYWFRFFTLAQENFPTLLRLFGYADFNTQITEPALLKYPPQHWAIFAAAEYIPLWLEEDYQEEDQSLLLQIAQIDAAYHKLFYAPSFLPYAPNRPISLQPFVSFLELDGDLLVFRQKLLSQEPEYWMDHEFPEIDFSKKHFFSFHQNKEDRYTNPLSKTLGIQASVIATEISETEFRHLQQFKQNSTHIPPKEWLDQWIAKDWIGQI